MISFLTKNIFKYLSSHKTNDVDQSLEQAVMMIGLKELILNCIDVRNEEEQNAAYEETKDTPIDSSWVIVDSREGKFKCNRKRYELNFVISPSVYPHSHQIAFVAPTHRNRKDGATTIQI